ncbi:MAG: response regulator, partial [Acidimicrobiales bacterium]
GGSVAVYSEVGIGTTFKVYLPATEEVAEDDNGGALVEQDVPGSRGTVLVVEDEEPVRNVCRRILETSGYSVMAAPDGPSALAMLDGRRVDLLLTDVVMTGGMTGRDLAARFLTQRPDVPVLFMSGYNADAIAKRGVLLPGVHVIEKPFTAVELATRVSQLL